MLVKITDKINPENFSLSKLTSMKYFDDEKEE
jgi:hypothetical protein